MEYEKYAKLRDAKGLKDAQVSKMSGVAPSTFSDWKSGRSYPKIEKLHKIMTAIGHALETGIDCSSAEKSLLDLLFASDFTEEDIDVMRHYHSAPEEIQIAIRKLLDIKRDSKLSKEA